LPFLLKTLNFTGILLPTPLYKRYIDQLANFMKDKQDMNFLDFFEYEFIGQTRGRTGSTVKKYYSTLNLIKNFGRLTDFGDLTYSNIQKFDDYLRSKKLATETL
jgi:hypothetical protein